MSGAASTLVTILFFGISYGMVLYVISVGLSVTMGLMNFVNLAHGVFAMLGGYATVSLMNGLGVPFGAALPLGALMVMAVGFLLERAFYSRLYGAAELDQVLFSIALMFIAAALVRIAWGPLAQPVRLPELLSGRFELLGVALPSYRLFVLLVGLVIVAGLWLLFERSRLGAAIRAAVDNRAMAQSIGIDTDRLFALTFGGGTFLAALGGGLGAEILPVAPGYPFEYVVYFLIVVAVGGLGSVAGPFLAAVLVGVMDTAFKYVLPDVGAIFMFAFVFLFLLVRPQGLFGRR